MLAVQSSLYVDLALIIGVFVFVMANKRKALSWALLIACLAVYSFLVFSRKPTPAAHAMLTPFWSYREAFGGGGIQRLGLAREILMNILVYVPFGLILSAILQDSRHPILYPVLVGMALSIATETIQYFGHLGLMETDDVINNTAGALLGVAAYRAGIKLKRRIFHP